MTTLTSHAARFKALSEPPRLEILALLLRHGELCVCDVEATLELTQSRASRHLAVLARAGFVEGRRAGKWVHYRVMHEPDPLIRRLLDVVSEVLPAARLDAISERLAEVRAEKHDSPACDDPGSEEAS